MSAKPARPGPGDTGLAVGLNETKTIPGKDVRGYAVSGDEFLDVTYSQKANQFVITGKRAGTTSLLLLRNDGATLRYVIDVS